MIYNNKNIALSIIFAFILSLGCCFAEQVNRKGEKAGVVMSKNKDITVRAESVTTNDGITVGFRIELINSNLDKNLVLVLHSKIYYHFRVRLINKEGRNVSPRPQLMPANKSNNTNKYDIIPPGVSRIWFIPVPNQIRVSRKRNDKKLQPTPNSKYMAKVIISAPYFTQNKEKKNIKKSPEFKNLQLTLPNIPIQIDSKSFNQDIEKIYKETKK